MGEAGPALSVVVPSVNGWAALEPTLDALAAQNGVPVEVLVPDRLGPAVREPVRTRFPDVLLLEAPPGTPIPALRAMAFRAARAPVVGVIEDHVLVPPDWAARMLDAHRAGAEVVGGAIENAARERLVDWAAFLCEYSHCLAPDPARDEVPGNNVTYRRDLLERHGAVVERGGWEYELHAALREAGVTFQLRPEILVGHRMHYTGAAEYAGQRFLYSRSFAALRLRGRTPAARAAYGLAALALPPVLFARVVARVWRSGRHRAELVRSLPLLAVFVTAWALGETAGAWLGPGDALARVR